jgi:hypothetical protein
LAPLGAGMRKNVQSSEKLLASWPMHPMYDAPASVEIGRFRILPHRREVG